MRIIPVIDLRAGRAVHGRGGKRDGYGPVLSRLGEDPPQAREPLDLSEPAALLRAYLRALRPEILYVADLDRIQGDGHNDGAVSRLTRLAPSLTVLWDGGFAGAREAMRARPLPALVPVLATETLQGPDQLACLGGRQGEEPPVLSLDLSEEGVVARAASIAALGEKGILRAAALAGARRAILLFLRRVGTSRGLPEDRLLRLKDAAPELELLVGGGIARLEELRFLRRAGFAGALLATALHAGGIGPQDLESEGFLS